MWEDPKDTWKEDRERPGLAGPWDTYVGGAGSRTGQSGGLGAHV